VDTLHAYSAHKSGLHAYSVDKSGMHTYLADESGCSTCLLSTAAFLDAQPSALCPLPFMAASHLVSNFSETLHCLPACG